MIDRDGMRTPHLIPSHLILILEMDFDIYGTGTVRVRYYRVLNKQAGRPAGRNEMK